MKINFLKRLKNQIVIYNQNHYNFRPADSIIILAYFGGCCSFIIFIKNVFLDIVKTTPVDYNIYVWTRVKPYRRIDREPFIFKPEMSEYRDLEKYNKYMDDKQIENSHNYSKAGEEHVLTYIPLISREIVNFC
jgi:hypothetical protein